MKNLLPKLPAPERKLPKAPAPPKFASFAEVTQGPFGAGQAWWGEQAPKMDPLTNRRRPRRTD